jgi:hypothetical protein
MTTQRRGGGIGDQSASEAARPSSAATRYSGRSPVHNQAPGVSPLALDDELLAKAEAYTGIRQRAALVRPERQSGSGPAARDAESEKTVGHRDIAHPAAL